MIGTIKPLSGAAVAHDGKKTVAMLHRKDNESMPSILERLDRAVAKARATGIRVDEINRAGADRTYEI